jgi:FixJ family two-component response regulator
MSPPPKLLIRHCIVLRPLDARFVKMGSAIIVVDDDRGFRKGLERLLKAHGFAVTGYASAEEFETAADPDSAACIILDIGLGGASGIELGHRLSAAGHAVPLIFITANDSETVRQAALDCGCLAYLEKPFPASALIEALDRRHRNPDNHQSW